MLPTISQGRNRTLISQLIRWRVKAAWIEFTDDDLKAGKAKRYYIAEYKSKTYGLTSLHIITKDLPKWFWCTFHHLDSPTTGAEVPDTFGLPQELKGTVWENYKLGGTQTDFVSAIGEPTLLSDPYIEKGFEKSSCVSCHAPAAASPSLVPAFGPNPSKIGVPNPADYMKNGKPTVVQTDFLWALPLRVKSESDQ
jgi:hypothetical protein